MKLVELDRCIFTDTFYFHFININMYSLYVSNNNNFYFGFVYNSFDLYLSYYLYNFQLFLYIARLLSNLRNNCNKTIYRYILMYIIYFFIRIKNTIYDMLQIIPIYRYIRIFAVPVLSYTRHRTNLGRSASFEPEFCIANGNIRVNE